MSIHKTSIIHPEAHIADDVTIGPFCYIGPKVFIDSYSVIGANVVIESWTKLGKNCEVSSGSVLGGAPQVTDYNEKPSWVHIGDKTQIREFVTIHRSNKENGVTSIGSDVYLMAYAHVAHDCQIGNKVVITNNVGMSGHVIIEDKAVIGGHTAIHQFIRIGKLAMIGGMTRLTKDVLPFSLVGGNPPKLYGINSVGLRRDKKTSSVRKELKKAFKFISRSNLNTSQALDQIRKEIPDNEDLKYLCAFIESSKRGIHK